ncbi:MAG: DUF4019 domain-containing protein [Candidatus Andeanibacterium colombiense]|uniref:DUF4019 domain-containing protein n=1 Tax=Candidatus Andeanibacterium colombiense TaxID=3121345 RepID=A0AAJ5XC41_9SPHN|nr:MAG: DUF4019 domain-containing protein [Sphingomonadaceae bacterium]
MWRRGSGSDFLIGREVKHPFTLRLLLPLAVAVLLPLPAQAEDIPTSARVVNVTSDSVPGWSPSEELERNALGAAEAYFAAVEQGDDAGAYRMTEKILDLAEDRYISDNRTFREQAGSLVARKFNQVTWTKDSPAAPLPGIFVAMDITAKYQKIDRFCGYVVLHQGDPAGPFRVTRTESNYIANSDATHGSPEKLQAMWQQLSANCPNYQPLDLGEAADSTIGYASVAEALVDLRSRKKATFEERNGWTVAIDEEAMTMWSFSPPDYPAYPAVVKRTVVPDGAGSRIEMAVQCEASKEACDALVRTFAEISGMALP